MLPELKRQGIQFVIKSMTHSGLYGKILTLRRSSGPVVDHTTLRPWDLGQGDASFCFNISPSRNKSLLEVDHKGQTWVLVRLFESDPQPVIAQDESVEEVLSKVAKSETKQFWIRKEKSKSLDDEVLPEGQRQGILFVIKSMTHSGLYGKIQTLRKASGPVVDHTTLRPWDLGQGDAPFCFNISSCSNKSLLEVEHKGQAWVLVHLFDSSRVDGEDVEEVLSRVAKSETKQFWICKEKPKSLEVEVLPEEKCQGIHFVIKSCTHGSLHQKLYTMRTSKINPWDLGQGEGPFGFSMTHPKNKLLLEVEHMDQTWVLVKLFHSSTLKPDTQEDDDLEA